MIDEETRKRARRIIGARLDEDFDVSRLTTYRVGGLASFHFVAETFEDLEKAVLAHRELGLPLLVLGRGSNILVADAGFEGLVLQLGGFASEISMPTSDLHSLADGVRVTAGSAVALPVLARRTAAAGLAGFEWAVGVPGTVGGAVRMNAGGHGSDMSASLVSALVLDVASGDVVTRSADSLEMGFRHSNLTDSEVVLEAVLGLMQADARSAMSLIDDIVKWRRENQPGGQNAGSVFVNPVPNQVSAGQLIDECGLRGLRIGTAEVSVKHANFIQADPDGSADDVVSVMIEVRRRVEERTGHRLRCEIRMVGFPVDKMEALS